jgi:hypothetical protein
MYLVRPFSRTSDNWPGTGQPTIDHRPRDTFMYHESGPNSVDKSAASCHKMILLLFDNLQCIQYLCTLIWVLPSLAKNWPHCKSISKTLVTQANIPTMLSRSWHGQGLDSIAIHPERTRPILTQVQNWNQFWSRTRLQKRSPLWQISTSPAKAYHSWERYIGCLLHILKTSAISDCISPVWFL